VAQKTFFLYFLTGLICSLRFFQKIKGLNIYLFLKAEDHAEPNLQTILDKTQVKRI